MDSSPSPLPPPAVDPPVLETARLRLTPHRVEDFEPLAAMWADPAVVAQISGKPSTLMESWMRLLRYRGLWPLLGYGYWAVRERESGRYVGDFGFADFHREMQPSIRGLPEAGWALAQWAHGRGYASEALAAGCAWLDSRKHAESVCLITPENGASLRVAEKNGYSERRLIELKEISCWLMTRRTPVGLD